MKYYFPISVGKLAFLAAFTSAVSASTLSTKKLPIVDLGYSIHQATINSSGEYPYLNFSNIRFAQPPVGNLRFSAPVPPKGRNTTINDGNFGPICTQAGPPAWTGIAGEFIVDYLTGQNISNFTNPPTPMMPMVNISFNDPQASEDCLFLDVIVPQKIFNASSQSRNGKAKGKGAPVLVWIYGGGFAGGYKTASGSPAGLIAESQQNGKEGVVYVAMNYRLGLFGWLAGSPDVTANAGLLDQRLALDWVQENIHKFGGDPNRVTVMGESAGASSVLHQITAYGGKKGPVPFQKAIPQSPAFLPIVPESAKSLFDQVVGNASLLSNTTITTAKQLRSLSYDALISLNDVIIGNSPYGQFTFGPVIDSSEGSFVPDLPARLLSQGAFDRNIDVLVGHNTMEGLLFSNPAVQTEQQFLGMLAQALPTVNASLGLYIVRDLYPPIYNGSYGYTSAFQRTVLAVEQLVITCNAYDIASTFSSKGNGSSFAYLFSVPPGLHGEDVSYTFFNGDTSTPDEGLGVQAATALAFQQYLTNFAMSGIPSEGTLLPPFAPYGANETVTDISSQFAEFGSHIKDPAADPRCDFWLSVPYYQG